MRTAAKGLCLIGVGLSSLLAAACEGPTDPMERGQARFEQCAPCHGARGQGKPELAAPPIGGLPEWYVKAQLDKFRIGARGAHVDDAAGLRMRTMSLTMPAERDVDAVARYVSTLPRAAPALAHVEGGDAARGQRGFGTCAGCHGADGGGNQALHAPPIAGQADWYLATQLANFKRGIRGKNPNDPTGPTMQAIAAGLDDQQIKDLAAYAGSMAKN
jgi:cytochrome c553